MFGEFRCWVIGLVARVTIDIVGRVAGLGSITIDDYDYDYDYMSFLFIDYDYDYSSL